MRSMVRLGYAYPTGKILNPPKKKLSKATLLEAAGENLLRIADALEWNSSHDIRLFRIPSETVPFDFHLKERGFWKEPIGPDARILGEYMQEGGIRIFMRGSPLYSLGSPDKDVAGRGMDEIEHFCSLLDLMGLDFSSKIIVNVGRVQGSRGETAKRFVSNFNGLSPSARRRTVIENDAFHWPFYEAFGVAGKLNIPIVFNYAAFLENRLTELSASEVAKISSISWKRGDAPQKALYSEGSTHGKRGSISRNSFLKFYREMEGLGVDVVLDSSLGGRSVLKARQFLEEVP